MPSQKMQGVGGGQSGRQSREAQRFNFRYLLVLCGLAVFVAFSHGFMNQAMQTQTGDAAEINQAGRQRMLTERMALKLYEISSLPPGSDLEQARDDLQKVIADLETSHEALVNGDVRLNLSGIRSDKVRAWYFGPEGQVDRNLKAILAAAREFLSTAPQNHQSPTGESHHQTIQNALEGLLRDLDMVVFLYQQESDVRLAWAKTVGQLNTVILLLLLLASALWVFRPMSRQINTAIVELLETQGRLKEARDRAEDASKAKSAFLANMSHELRTPLNSIIGYSEVLLEDAGAQDDTTFTPHLKKVLYAGQHLSSLINDILDFSKIEAGKAELSVEDIRLPDLVEEVTATVQPLIDNGNNKFTLDVPLVVETPIRNDAMKLRQVLVNLLGNAAKFTENGDIGLSVKVEDVDANAWLTFTIMDTGIGMSPDQIDNLFEEFAQADTSTSRKYQGTGLGLAISKHFVAMMGGSIEVRSAKNAGSTFIVRLPANLDEHDVDGPVAANLQKQGEAHNGQTTILVVDDDPNARELMVRHLTKEGFQVTTASSGEEALNRALNLVPDLITLDIMMDDMSGWDVLRQLKNAPQTCATPVIMCSIIDDRNRGFSLGAIDYLTKPINCPRLIQSIERHIQRSSLGEILIVEDDQDTRALVAKYICDFGFTPREAANGLEALKLIKNDNPPVLVVLDLMMPEMDGFEFLQAFREIPAFAQIPVVVVTAMDLSEAERAVLRDMSADIVLKSQNNLKQTLSMLTTQILTELPATQGAGGGDG